MKTYEAVLRGFPVGAITEAAHRFTAGLVEGQNRSFAPSTAEFMVQVRKIDEIQALQRDRPKMPQISAQPYHSTGRAPFEIEAEKLRQKYANREILKVGVSYDQWRSMRHELPHGHTWIGALNGTIFGPEIIIAAEAAE